MMPYVNCASASQIITPTMSASAAGSGFRIYKIVDLDGNKIKTLFHGLNGSRVIQRRVWIPSECKLVRDGTSKTWYESGWHVFMELEATKFYLEKFKNMAPKAIIIGRARGLRPKEHSPSPVLLADQLFVERIVWRPQGE